MKFEVYKQITPIRRREKWGWRLVADNGRIVAVAGEKFTSFTDASWSAIRVQEGAQYAAVITTPGGNVLRSPSSRIAP